MHAQFHMPCPKFQRPDIRFRIENAGALYKRNTYHVGICECWKFRSVCLFTNYFVLINTTLLHFNYWQPMFESKTRRFEKGADVVSTGWMSICIREHQFNLSWFFASKMSKPHPN